MLIDTRRDFYTPIYISNGVCYYYKEYVNGNQSNKYPLDAEVIL